MRPVLSAHIHYANRTTDNSLRHAVFKGLRGVELSTPVTATAQALIAEADLATIWVTNPTRRIFGKSGPTKLDIAVYYAFVGDFMLPHILGRPVSLVRCPTGRPQDCFFQRHAFTGMPASVATFETDQLRGRDQDLPLGRGRQGLSGAGAVRRRRVPHLGRAAQAARQAGPHRLRPRSGRGHRLARDRRGGGSHQGRAGGAQARAVRQDVGRQGHPCGGAGDAKTRLEAGFRATSDIAARIAATAPETFTTTMGKGNRKKRIFIDFHRNGRGATAAAPYSLRARTNLPASTPVSWSRPGIHRRS